MSNVSNAHRTLQVILHITYFTHTIHDPPPPPPPPFASAFRGNLLELMQSLQIERCERRIHCIYFTRINFTHTNNIVDVEWEIKRWKFETKLNKQRKKSTQNARACTMYVCVCVFAVWALADFTSWKYISCLRRWECFSFFDVPCNRSGEQQHFGSRREKQQQTICQ